MRDARGTQGAAPNGHGGGRERKSVYSFIVRVCCCILTGTRTVFFISEHMGTVEHTCITW